MLREAWQRRWEPCSPVRYRRDVSKRSLSDGSFRELEAWAARYSHSLPRRRRMEVGLLESNRTVERDSRSATVPRVAALHQSRFSANRDLGQWDRGGRQQTVPHCPPQPPVPDACYMSDTTEKTCYQRRVFSRPPGYIAPPPYNSPHKVSPVMPHGSPVMPHGSPVMPHGYRYSTGWEQEGSVCPQPTLRNQDVPIDVQDERGREEDEWRQSTFSEFEGHTHQRLVTDASWSDSPIDTQSMRMQPEYLSFMQQPTTMQGDQNRQINEDIFSKVIEGRKFKSNRKPGGKTIFCLVSRISGSTETSSLPLYTPQTNVQSTELGEVSSSLRDCNDVNKAHKLADEVDFTETSRSPVQPSSPRSLKAKHNRAPTWAGTKQAAACRTEMLGSSDLFNKTEPGDKDPTFRRQVAQSVSPVTAKYPLWRQPSFTGRVENESSSPGLKANGEGGESGGLLSRDNRPKMDGHPIDIKVRRLEINNDTESEDSCGLLVIDTTCVVVRMELIPSPKTEQVHSAYTEHSPLDNQSTTPSEPIQSNERINQDVTTDQNTETSTQINPSLITESETDLLQAEELLQTYKESQFSVPCLSSLSVSQRETMEERAESILGIPLLESVIQTEDVTSICDSCVEDQDEEAASPPLKDIEHLSEDVTGEAVPQQEAEFGQAEVAARLKESDDTQDLLDDEVNEDFPGLREKTVNIFKGNAIDCQPEADANSLTEIEMTQEPNEVRNEQSQIENNQFDDKDADPQDPSQCLSPPTDLSHSSPHSPSDFLDCNSAVDVMLSPSQRTSLSHVPESDTEESPEPELDSLPSLANLVPHNETPLISEASPFPHTPPLPSLRPPDSTALSSRSSSPPQDRSPSPQSLHSSSQPEDEMSNVESCCEDPNGEPKKPQLTDTEISDTFEQLSKDVREEPVSQQGESVQTEDAVCVKGSQVQLPKEDNDELTCLWEQASNITKEHSTDCQSQIEANVLQGMESQTGSDSAPQPPSETPHCEMCPVALDVMRSPSQLHSLSHETNESNPNPASRPERPSLTALHPETMTETSPAPHLDSHKPALRLPSPSELALPLHSSSTPPQEESASVSPGFPPSTKHTEKSQHPKSLWDAVNRIRKHTAPDSENEEEEVSELWDPESVGEVVELRSEDFMFHCGEGLYWLGLHEAAVSSPTGGSSETGEKLVSDEPWRPEVLKEKSGEDIGIMGRLEEDTMSCCSTNSHGSETTADTATESETETEGEKEKEEEEERLSCSEKVINTVVEGEDERGANESCQSEVCLVEEENNITQTETKETDISEEMTT